MGCFPLGEVWRCLVEDAAASGLLSTQRCPCQVRGLGPTPLPPHTFERLNSYITLHATFKTFLSLVCGNRLVLAADLLQFCGIIIAKGTNYCCCVLQSLMCMLQITSMQAPMIQEVAIAFYALPSRLNLQGRHMQHDVHGLQDFNLTCAVLSVRPSD